MIGRRRGAAAGGARRRRGEAGDAGQGGEVEGGAGGLRLTLNSMLIINLRLIIIKYKRRR